MITKEILSDDVLETLLKLPEYQRKHLAAFLIASTLSPDSRDYCVADINNTENLKLDITRDEPLPF